MDQLYRWCAVYRPDRDCDHLAAIVLFRDHYIGPVSVICRDCLFCPSTRAAVHGTVFEQYAVELVPDPVYTADHDPGSVSTFASVRIDRDTDPIEGRMRVGPDPERVNIPGSLPEAIFFGISLMLCFAEERSATPVIHLRLTGLKRLACPCWLPARDPVLPAVLGDD